MLSLAQPLIVDDRMEAAGIEPPQENPRKTALLASGGAKCGALTPDLAELIDAWPTLPEAIRAGILAMVRAAREE